MTAVERPSVADADLATLDEPVRALLRRVGRLNEAATPDLGAIGAELVGFATDLDYVTRWVERLGDVNGALPIHALEPSHSATLLPPDDLHDHGHLTGHGAPAYVLIMTGDDQTLFTRNEWDAATGREGLMREHLRGVEELLERVDADHAGLAEQRVDRDIG